MKKISAIIMIVGDGFNTFSLSREAGSFSQPTAYGISQAYPNPFNPVTNITSGIDQDAYVQVKVYDITGKEIATLADGTYFSGYHNLSWNADNFASGMYFVSLEVDNYIQTQKILLLK